ncbi:hypothetical protein [Actinomadura flavalba]|uniref:hypothetical protein n=1 Tax=Actinomadura flavalba TaxID=1120938 RepID=UPI0003794C18|nr:hypothetical protein [Actinomadura flavalba]
MRRLAAAALAVGTALAGTVVAAAPAQAAAKSFTTKNGWGTLKAYGNYTKTSKKLTIKVWLADGKAYNGWSPGVQFRTADAKKTKWKNSAVYYFVDKSTKKPADRVFSAYRGAYTKGYTGHVYVREIGVKVSNGQTVAGPWSKLK